MQVYTFISFAHENILNVTDSDFEISVWSFEQGILRSFFFLTIRYMIWEPVNSSKIWKFYVKEESL